MTTIERIRKEYKKTNNIRAKKFLEKLQAKRIRKFTRKNRYMNSEKYILPDERGRYNYWNTALVLYWECINPEARGDKRYFAEGEIYYNPKYENIMDEVILEEVTNNG